MIPVSSGILSLVAEVADGSMKKQKKEKGILEHITRVVITSEKQNEGLTTVKVCIHSFKAVF